jgi:hypothetical protein
VLQGLHDEATALRVTLSMLRSLMGRHLDFWHLTEDGLVYACKSLALPLTAEDAGGLEAAAR